MKAFGPVTLEDAGSAELDVVPREKAARRLARKGRVTVNPRVRFVTAAGTSVVVRHEFNLRLNG